MPSLIAGLGAFGSGVAPGLEKLFDEQSTSDFGNALAKQYGGTPQQSGLGSILDGVKNLFGGSQQAQAGASPLSMMPPSQSVPMGPQGGQAQGGMQQPQMQQTPPPPPMQQSAPPPQMQSPQPAPAPPPPIAQPAAQGGGMPQQQPQPQPQPPPQTPPQQMQQAYPAQQPQQQGGGQGQQQLGQGPLDLPTLVKSLIANGVSGHRLGAAVKQVIPLLNAQGLAQYHQMGLQLREEDIRDREAQRKFDRNPDAPGSRANARVTGAALKQEGMDRIQARFDKRFGALTEKIRDAKTDKELKAAKADAAKVASELKGEMQTELNIMNNFGASDEEKADAAKRMGEIRQQYDDAVKASIATRRQGGASGDQVGGFKGGERAPDQSVKGQEVSQPHVPGATRPGPGGKTYRFKGGDWDSQDAWEPV